MKRYLLPTAGILSVLLLVGVILFFVLNPPEPEEDEADDNRDITQGQINGDSITGDDGPATGPGGVPAKEDIPDEILGEEDGHGTDEHHDHENDTLLNLGAYEQLAITAVREYVQYNTSESAAARTERLKPYFRPGSSYLTDKPVIALEKQEKQHNWAVKAGITGKPYAGLYRTTATEFVYKVAADYWGEYFEPVSHEQQGTASWTVTIPYEKDTNGRMVLNAEHVTSLTEPVLNMR